MRDGRLGAPVPELALPLVSYPRLLVRADSFLLRVFLHRTRPACLDSVGRHTLATPNCQIAVMQSTAGTAATTATSMSMLSIHMLNATTMPGLPIVHRPSRVSALSGNIQRQASEVKHAASGTTPHGTPSQQQIPNGCRSLESISTTLSLRQAISSTAARNRPGCSCHRSHTCFTDACLTTAPTLT